MRPYEKYDDNWQEVPDDYTKDAIIYPVRDLGRDSGLTERELRLLNYYMGFTKDIGSLVEGRLYGLHLNARVKILVFRKDGSNSSRTAFIKRGLSLSQMTARGASEDTATVRTGEKAALLRPAG